jgi:hypothetical protein
MTTGNNAQGEPSTTCRSSTGSKPVQILAPMEQKLFPNRNS